MTTQNNRKTEMYSENAKMQKRTPEYLSHVMEREQLCSEHAANCFLDARIRDRDRNRKRMERAK